VFVKVLTGSRMAYFLLVRSGRRLESRRLRHLSWAVAPAGARGRATTARLYRV